MALPASYTEDTFKAYLHSLLNQGGFATDLGWSVVGGSYDSCVEDVALMMDVDDISTLTGRANIAKLRAAGKACLWRTVASATAHMRDSRTVDGSSSSLSQVYAHAVKELQRAESEAEMLGVGNVVPGITISAIRYKDDPYQHYESGDEY